jgi:tetratricopeptide (TPR) repeat protein
LEFPEHAELASEPAISPCGAILALAEEALPNPVSIFKTRLPVRLTPASYVFAGGLLVQLVILLRVTNSPLFLPIHGDMAFYNDWARRILAGRGGELLAFYGLPGYAYGLAALYYLFGYNPFIPALIQACANAGTGALLYNISVRLFAANEANPARGPVIGVLAAAGWAFFQPAQAYGAVLMPTILSVLAFWFVVWQIIARDSLPSFIFFLLLGIFIGINATAVATILFLLPLVIAACFCKWQAAGSPRQFWITRLLCPAALFFGVIMGTAPCWIHNYVYARDPVIFSAHSGVNFWIGNNPIATGYPRFPAGLRAGQESMLHDSIKAAEQAARHPLKRSEVSAYWSRQARDYIQNHFTDWVRLLGTKVANFWSAFQYDDLSVITTLREEGVIFPGIRFGLVAALALAAGIFAILETPAVLWIAGAIILHLCALLPVFVTERYRLAAVPGLLIFAAFGLWWFAHHLRQPRLVTAFALALVVAVAMVARPVTERSLWSLDAYNSGILALDINRYDIAEEKLAAAYSYSPDNAEVNFALGNLRMAQQNKPEAKNYYLKAIILNPNHEGAFNNLGVLALEEERWRLAQYFLRQALRQNSGEATTHFLLAKSLMGERDRAGARAEVETAIALNPEQPEFRALREQLAQP